MSIQNLLICKIMNQFNKQTVIKILCAHCSLIELIKAYYHIIANLPRDSEQQEIIKMNKYIDFG